MLRPRITRKMSSDRKSESDALLEYALRVAAVVNSFGFFRRLSARDSPERSIRAIRVRVLAVAFDFVFSRLRIAECRLTRAGVMISVSPHHQDGIYICFVLYVGG